MGLFDFLFRKSKSGLQATPPAAPPPAPKEDVFRNRGDTPRERELLRLIKQRFPAVTCVRLADHIRPGELYMSLDLTSGDALMVGYPVTRAMTTQQQADTAIAYINSVLR